jgi:hypothetical protein
MVSCKERVMNKPAIAIAVVVILAVILIVFRLRNRGPRPEDSVEFRRQVLYASAGRGMIDAMAGGQSASPPWSAFVTVKDRLRMRDQVLARRDLHRIAESSTSSVLRLIAWNMLRELGENPDATVAQPVQGVVVELPGPAGAEVLAVYADGSATRLDPSGNLTQWTPMGATADLVKQQIEEAQKLVAEFPPPGGLPVPASSTPRITLLTFAGMRSKEVSPDNGALRELVARAKEILGARAS